MADLLTIRTDIHTAFNNIIAVNTDTKITSTNVFSSFNNRQLIRNGYPQVIIREATVLAQKLTIGSSESAATDIYRVPFRVSIEIYNSSASNVKTVADEVFKACINGKERLRETYGLYNINFEEDSVQVVEFTQRQTTHIYTLTVTGTFIDTG